MIKNLNRFYITASLMFLCAQSTNAVTIPSVMKETMAQDAAGMPSLFNLIISMVVVIGLIYFTGWIYSKLNVVNKKKMKEIAAQHDDDDASFTILQSMPLGQQKHLYLIEVKDKILLVGSTQQNISLLKDFDKSSLNKDKITIENIQTSDSIQDTLYESKPKDEQSTQINIDELYKKYKN